MIWLLPNLSLNKAISLRKNERKPNKKLGATIVGTFLKPLFFKISAISESHNAFSDTINLWPAALSDFNANTCAFATSSTLTTLN